MSVEMKIADIFHFQTGETVFVGSIVGEKKSFKDSEMRLSIDNKEDCIVKIAGQMLTDRPHPLGYRGISTYDSIELTSDFVKNHECKLIEIEAK